MKRTHIVLLVVVVVVLIALYMSQPRSPSKNLGRTGNDTYFGVAALGSFLGGLVSGAKVAPPTATSPDAYQTSAAARAYADQAGGVLPNEATSQDYAEDKVVYGPFLSS